MVANVAPLAVTKGCVLVADDDGTLTRACGRSLSRAGYEVSLASCGQDAMDLIRSRPFDVIVSDIAMPDVDGIALLRAAREIDPNVPVILMSGVASFDAAIKAIELGAFRYLLKPFGPKALEEVVEKAAALSRVAKMKQEALELVTRSGSQLADRAGLESSFGRTLESLWIAFQPIVSWARRETYGYEALVRTRDAAISNPKLLFDAAERLGRVHDVGAIIRARIADEIERAPETTRLFVNLHPHDLLDERLYDAREPLSRFSPRISLEVTERAALDEVADVTARIGALRKMGYAIALDDLGAGYAGLTSFAQLEPQVVKLDMSLIRGVERDATRQRLVGSMASLCRELKMEVISEGVETREERDMLASLGCDLMQGYLFGAPRAGFQCPVWG